ncbi:cytochrome [Sesamum angolense]|uniref:Cytochrome n=1 Tax=Sesamum angolense TaxID=2727404 RepID=A0AAE2C4F8_9LAMI|nr:cytochrome [Sesamum angolense]
MLDFNTTSICFLSLSLASLSLIFVLVYSHFNHHHKNPCPQSYPLIGNLIGFLHNRHRFHDWVAELLSTSPSLTIQVNGFLGFSHGICTADPAGLEHLLRSNFSNYVKGTRFQSVLCELLGNGIFNVDGELWFAQRRISIHEFKTTSLKCFISDTVQSQLATRFIPCLSSACKNQEVVDLQDVLRRFTFDNICNVAFGVDPAWLDSKNDDQTSLSSSFVRAFDYAVEISSHRLLLPFPVVWKIKRLLNIGSEKHYKKAVRIINDYALKIILSKEQSCQNKDGMERECYQDLLSRFVHSSLDLEFHDVDEKRRFLRDIVISFILAGKDSTSTALTWFFWLIAGHPHCERLIYNELAAASPDKFPCIFSYDKLKELNYLHAALSESLRLFPPIPINSRLAMSSDTLSNGTYVRKGWFADYSAYAMGRMERLWGADCREFRPERWLDENGVFQPCDQFKFPVFHCGPRMCLGKEMAYVQMKSIAAAMMYKFEVVAVDGGGCPERIVNPPYTLSLFLKMKGGLPVRLKRREEATA